MRPAPFGSELFCGGNLTATTVGVVDPTYIMKPGDQIALTLWGSVPDSNTTAVVDTNGNIFVPGVGPVRVGGQSAGNVNGIVKAAAAAVYRTAVHIYAAPVTTVPINVFVTGPVVAPGPYAGLGSDSPVAFLQRAGGIDANRGSYRNIQVKRNGVTVAHIDLYEFLRTGDLPRVTLHNNDTIVVGQQGSIVSVSGLARAPFTFELGGPSGVGEELLYYARPRPEVNYVALLGYRSAQPLNLYRPGAELRAPAADGRRPCQLLRRRHRRHRAGLGHRRLPRAGLLCRAQGDLPRRRSSRASRWTAWPIAAGSISSGSAPPSPRSSFSARRSRGCRRRSTPSRSPPPPSPGPGAAGDGDPELHQLRQPDSADRHRRLSAWRRPQPVCRWSRTTSSSCRSSRRW